METDSTTEDTISQEKKNGTSDEVVVEIPTSQNHDMVLDDENV